jgi:hypothetical protein
LMQPMPRKTGQYTQWPRTNFWNSTRKNKRKKINKMTKTPERRSCWLYIYWSVFFFFLVDLGGGGGYTTDIPRSSCCVCSVLSTNWPWGWKPEKPELF